MAGARMRRCLLGTAAVIAIPGGLPVSAEAGSSSSSSASASFSSRDAGDTSAGQWPQATLRPEDLDAAIEELQQNEELTPREVAAFRARVSEADTRGQFSTRGAPLGRSELRMSLYGLIPVVTEAIVQQINELDLDWFADLEAWTDEELTMENVQAKLGYVAAPEIENASADLSVLQSGASASSGVQYPSDFNAADKYTKCREAFGHIRDQGKCGSCWAQAFATSMDIRLCIATYGRFQGSRAWISAGYATSCYGMQGVDGCQGGNPAVAEMMAAKRGNPTGNEGSGTCVPYFGSGNSLDHFSGGNLRAPACPTRCTHSYPRSLQADRFYPTGAVTSSPSMSHAKGAVYEKGAIPVAFIVYRDFMSYRSGYYDKTSNTKMGGHATTMVGWKSHYGKDYVVAMNSWGQKWGESGRFKMNSHCCDLSFFIVDKVSSHQKALPLPSGSGGGSGGGGGGSDHRESTCKSIGCGRYHHYNSCQCNAACNKYGSCCSDYQAVCGHQGGDTDSPSGSCAHYGCGGEYKPYHSCQCSRGCEKFDNCCSDYKEKCGSHEHSPTRRRRWGSCAKFGCGSDFRPDHPCQCSYSCNEHHNCCRDFWTRCHHGTIQGAEANMTNITMEIAPESSTAELKLERSTRLERKQSLMKRRTELLAELRLLEASMAPAL
eukprot:TRINITY_DN5966_c0_g1_i1.p1 TRINITY_DN5966_c0_g1~~TRINITY_DN5966_c0_g1_i1.p1  ORF type:complete len:669 (+),score=122.07 TRINITY_DN5966_c0_g1_i1:25-2007(+)